MTFHAFDWMLFLLPFFFLFFNLPSSWWLLPFSNYCKMLLIISTTSTKNFQLYAAFLVSSNSLLKLLWDWWNMSCFYVSKVFVGFCVQAFSVLLFLLILSSVSVFPNVCPYLLLLRWPLPLSPVITFVTHVGGLHSLRFLYIPCVSIQWWQLTWGYFSAPRCSLGEAYSCFCPKHIGSIRVSSAVDNHRIHCAVSKLNRKKWRMQLIYLFFLMAELMFLSWSLEIYNRFNNSFLSTCSVV